MKADLDSLRSEIQSHLESLEFTVFHGLSRLNEPLPLVHWDTGHYPDFKQFLEVAKKLSVELISFHHRELNPEFIDNSATDLDAAEMPSDERQQFGRRLQELRVWEGFTSSVELSFAYQGQIYVYIRRAGWYDELLEIADEIDDYLSVEEEDEGDQPDTMGGYFSRN